MFSIHSIPFILLALFGSCSASPAIHQRETSKTTLFAYGGDTNGAPVFFADGLAYIGKTAPNSASFSTNVTFNSDPLSTTTPWTITPNSSVINTFNETLMLYIVPSTSSFTRVGFTSGKQLPKNATTTGFAWFGSEVSYAADGSEYEFEFWANATAQEGIYGLYWGSTSDGDTDGAFPVTLKSSPPTHL